jgi:hypothetical protein
MNQRLVQALDSGNYNVDYVFGLPKFSAAMNKRPRAKSAGY